MSRSVAPLPSREIEGMLEPLCTRRASVSGARKAVLMAQLPVQTD